MSDNLNNSRKPQAEKVATATAAGNISQQQQQQQQQEDKMRRKRKLKELTFSSAFVRMLFPLFADVW